MNGLFKIQDVKDVFITGLSELGKAHVRVLSDQFPDRTLPETVSNDQTYWNGTNKLHLQLKKILPAPIKVAYATQDQRETMDRPFTPVRTPPPPRAVTPPAIRADICWNCNKPGLSAAQCPGPYRPRERRKPPVDVHALLEDEDDDDGDVSDVQTDVAKNL